MTTKISFLSIFCALIMTSTSYADSTVGVGCTVHACSSCELAYGGGWTSGDGTIAYVDPTSGDVTGIAVGATQLTYTYTNSCGTGMLISNVNVVTPVSSSSVAETVPFALSGDAVYTYYPSAFTLTVNTTPGPISGANYTWYDATTSSTYGPYTTPDFSPSFTGGTSAVIHHFTVTTSYGGCTSNTNVDIVVPPAGCLSPYDYYNVNNYRASDGLGPVPGCSSCNVYQPFHTITASALTSSNVIDGANYYIVNNATLSKTTFNNDLFYMNGGVSLEVTSTSATTLHSCHLSSSPSCQWSGINVDVNGTSAGSLSLTLTLIENAGYTSTAAVNVVATGSYYTTSMPQIVYSNGSIYNNDYIGIYVDNYAPTIATTSVGATMPFSILGNVFTNRDLANTTATLATSYSGNYPFSWMTVTGMRFLSSPSTMDPGYGIDVYAALPISYTSATGHAGVVLENTCANALVSSGSSTTPTIYNYNYFQLGSAAADPSKTNINFYDNLVFGTQITNTNALLNDNTYRRLNVGVEIDNQANDVQIAGSGVYPNNNNNRFFENYQFGIHTGTYSPNDLTISNCQFTSTTYSGSGAWNEAIDMVEPGTLAYHNIHNINYNYIYNYGAGIHISYSGGTVGSGFNGNTLIQNNSIKGKATVGASPEETFYGIQVSDQGRSYSGTSGNGTIDISNNLVQGVKFGIQYVSSSISGSIYTNTVNLADYSAVPPLPVINERGIWVAATPYIAQVDNNIVGGWGYACQLGTSGFATTGIYVETVGTSTSVADISCNSVHDVYEGFDFFQASYLSWMDNQMMRNTHGMHLDGSGASIGQQGAACQPSDNHWDNGTTCSVCSTSSCASWSSWTAAGVAQTYIDGGANGSGSVIYYRPSGAYDITNNGAGGSSAAYSTASGTLVDATTGCSSLPSTPTCAMYSGFMPVHSSSTTGTIDAGNIIKARNYDLYPNPSNGYLEFIQSVATNAHVNVAVYNTLGQKVYDGELNFAGGKANITLNNAIPGIYQVKLSEGLTEVWNKKVVIEKNSFK